MLRTLLRLSSLGLPLVLLLTASPVLGETIQSIQSPDGQMTLHGISKPADAIAPAQLAHIRSAISAYEKRKAALGTRTKDDVPFLYPFFPQSGIQGQDLYLSNFTDQNPRRGDDQIQDWDCSDYTYDGHTGHDSIIRSFREQAIGVPAFAVLPGVVVDTHDGEPDMNTVWDDANQANYVIIDHGNGYFGWYFHFRAGSVAVSPGQTVTAGTQLGLTGSSGISNWPHLHFETQKDGHWIEPSTGPCHQGDSLWVSQPPVNRDFATIDFYMTHGTIPLPDRETLLLDANERTATFVKGFQTVGARIDMHNLPAGSVFDVRILNPHSQVAAEASGLFGNDVLFEVAVLTRWFDLDLNQVGNWRYQVVMNDSLIVDAPFKVVATSRQVANRPPNRITAHLTPPHPVDGQALTCVVQSPLLLRDPDFDIVSYHYEWRVNNRLVRSVTSAGLTDFLAAGMAKPRDKVNCRVTPTDGKRSGPVAIVNGIVAEP
ncbi:MAG TPA: M23 family metallopeptidase [Thermoanaerobaculia bacterium]|nr:M23 family metallopeptidase [Thermoanaerobaculia bacterium]